MLDCDGNKVKDKTHKLSEDGTWGGYFDNAPYNLYISFTRGRDTMQVTLRRIVSKYMILDGICFLKGKYEYSDFKASDTLPERKLIIKNWWPYNATANKEYPKPLYISGTVELTNPYDESYITEPAYWASVYVKGSNAGTAANFKTGHFRLDLTPAMLKGDTVILIFTCIGCKTTELIIHKKLFPVNDLRIFIQKAEPGEIGLVIKAGWFFETVASQKKKTIKRLKYGFPSRDNPNEAWK